MVIGVNTHMDIINDWFQSDQMACICGQDLKPVPHSLFKDRALCIIKGQGAVYFMEQVPYGNIWLLKIFAPGRRPSEDYLKAVSHCLPGAAEFFTCKQRRLLTREHVDLTSSGFKDTSLLSLMEGSVLMPKVPGMTWSSIADNLREGKLKLSPVRRLQMCINLAVCVSMLEAGQCSHRDISAMNVFFDENGHAYLIDWDCLYHPYLPFQFNTPVGTMGYIAPFLKANEGKTDGVRSWCLYADRFALCALIIEILLIGPDTDATHEDGSLFSQEQIDTYGHKFVCNQIEKLRQISKPCAVLAAQTFASSSFAGCPSPGDWLGVLKFSLRKQENVRRVITDRRQHRRFVRIACSKCGKSIKMLEDKVKILEDKGQSPLCRGCLQDLWNERSAAKAQRNIKIPQVLCEHCQRNLRLPREKLDTLLNNGRPILCSTCLRGQMEKWRAEYEKKYSSVVCAECGDSFNIRKEKLNVLKHKGKQVLCKDCLGAKLRLVYKSKTKFSTQRVGFASSLWKLIGRT